MPIRIHKFSDGARYVLRRHKGKVYAAVFEQDLNDRQIASRMAQGEAAFFPFDPHTKQVRWDQLESGQPLRFTH